MRTAGQRYRYHEAEAAPLDLEVPLPDDVIERAVRDLTGVEHGPIDPALLDRIVDLRLRGHSLRDLSPLPAFTRLQRLSLRAPGVRDLTPIARLGALKDLTLVDVAAEDLSPLAGLDKLERLRLEALPARDLAPLARLGRLTDLCLRRAPALDLTPLARLERLTIVEITDCAPIDELAPLATLPELAYVNLAGTRVRSTGGLTQRPSVHVEGLDSAASIRVIEPATGETPSPLGEIAHEAERLLRWPCRVAGLATRGELATAFEPNPWQLPPDLPLAAALDRVWQPLGRRAPQFRDRLRDQVTALALLSPLGGEEPVLAYVLDGNGDRRLLIGRAPRTAPEAPTDPLRLPLALRELYTVHAGLVGSTATLLAPAGLELLTASCHGRLDQFHRANRGAEPDRFHLLLTDEEGAQVFDLDRLDGRGDPLVRRFYAETGEVAGQAAFWDWFEDHAPELFLQPDPAG